MPTLEQRLQHFRRHALFALASGASTTPRAGVDTLGGDSIGSGVGAGGASGSEITSAIDDEGLVGTTTVRSSSSLLLLSHHQIASLRRTRSDSQILPASTVNAFLTGATWVPMPGVHRHVTSGADGSSSMRRREEEKPFIDTGGGGGGDGGGVSGATVVDGRPGIVPNMPLALNEFGEHHSMFVPEDDTGIIAIEESRV